MSLASKIAAHLPALRRYARAMAGSQPAGDGYVEEMLRSLVATLARNPQADIDPKSLYRLLSQIYAGRSPTALPESSHLKWERTITERMSALPVHVRQAYLLHVIEGFSLADVARILDLTDQDIRSLLMWSDASLADEGRSSVIIVEDEPIIALDIERIVTELGQDVAGVARTRGEAMKLFQDASPDLILADIKLPDGTSGLDVVNDMRDIRSVPTIFITAFPDEIKTTPAEPVMVVPKPFDPERLKNLIRHAILFRGPLGFFS